MYIFDWQSPVFDGKYKSVHCMEIPFVFDNVARANQMTGGGQAAHALADKVSQAWINFAKTGNPNHAGLPEWPAYNSSNTATMHFDTTCEVKPQLDKELFELTANQQ
jgi:para-nitrobenzyl esterase